MSEIMFFDVETTGLPVWKEPSGCENQPHIVQIGAIIADEDTRKVLEVIDVIVKPEGWEISQEMTDIHGISNDHAMQHGIDEETAVDAFIKAWSGKKRVAHNRTFDQRIIRIALKRYFEEEDQKAWADKDDFICTAIASKKHMPPTSGEKWGRRHPALKNAYKHFTGKEIENHHNALADAEACMAIFFAIQDIKDLKNNDS